MFKPTPQPPKPTLFDPGVKSTVFSGKFGAVGTQASGKTRGIMSVANYTSRKPIFSWDEEAELGGTVSIQPYTVEWTMSDRRVIIVDNPGQNSLEYLRKQVAKSGDSYKGLLVFIDSIGWNFSSVSLLQAKTIAETINYPEIPILLIVTKSDLLKKLLREELIDEIARHIDKTVKKIKKGDKIPYFNRVKTKVEWLVFQPEGEMASFTVLEQLFVNVVDEYARINAEVVKGLTKVNIRILIRSLLLGYGELLKTWLSLPDFSRKYPLLSIPEDLLVSLNYYRPTALETEISWKRMAVSEFSKEPFFPLSTFDYNRMLDTLKRVSISPENEENIKRDVLTKAKNILPSSEIAAPVIVNVLDRVGIQTLSEALENFIDGLKPEQRHQDKKNGLKLVNLPPKPEPRTFTQ